MATLEFNIRQRILLEILLGQQRGSISEIETFFDIRNKIKVEGREDYLRSLPSGEIIIDESLVNLAGTKEIQLEKEERKKLYELLTTTKTFSPNDLEWVLPLKKQLEAVL